MRCRTAKAFLAFLVVLGVSFQTAQAGDESPTSLSDSRLKIDGFGSLGIARSTNGQSEVLRSLTTPEGITDHWSARSDSNLGLQASYRFNDEVETVFQAVSHLRDDGSFHPNLTWAFLKYDVTPRFSVRLGRIGTEFLMQADSRLVGYSYLPVRPANEFYGVIPINYGDGVDARLRWPVGDGILRLEGFAGYAAEDTAQYRFSGTQILKGTLGYDVGDWQFRYINTRTKLANEFDQLDPLRNQLTAAYETAAAAELSLKGTISTYQSLGAAYDDGIWQVQGAINYIDHEATILQNSRAFHVLVGRRIGSVTPFVSYSQAKSSSKAFEASLSPFNPYAGVFSSYIAQALQSSHFDSKTLSLGARWDVRRNVDLKAQVDFVRAGKASNMLLINAPADSDFRSTVFSLSLDFIF